MSEKAATYTINFVTRIFPQPNIEQPEPSANYHLPEINSTRKEALTINAVPRLNKCATNQNKYVNNSGP